MRENTLILKDAEQDHFGINVLAKFNLILVWISSMISREVTSD